jgi:possible bacteriophage protein
VSELEKRDPLIRKPLSSVTYPRDININTGGGWVDYVSAMSVAYGITGGSGNGPIAAGGANGLPIIQANMDKGVFKAHVFAASLRVMFQDMQRANQLGRSLDQMLTDGMRMAYDKHADQNVYVGLEEYNTTGLVNNPDAVETTVAGNGATSPSTKWKDKTPKQILDDINTAITAAWAAAEYDESAMPNHILIPYEQYTYILNTMVTDLATETIMDYVMKNNVAAKNGGSLFIGATKWCKGAGAGSADRMIVYVNNERFLTMDELVPLSRIMSAPNVSNVCYDTAYMANLSEVQVMYPQTIRYYDGI